MLVKNFRRIKPRMMEVYHSYLLSCRKYLMILIFRLTLVWNIIARKKMLWNILSNEKMLIYCNAVVYSALIIPKYSYECNIHTLPPSIQSITVYWEFFCHLSDITLISSFSWYPGDGFSYVLLSKQRPTFMIIPIN